MFLHDAPWFEYFCTKLPDMNISARQTENIHHCTRMDTVERLEFLFTILWWRWKNQREKLRLHWRLTSHRPALVRSWIQPWKILADWNSWNSQQAMSWKWNGGELLWKGSVSRYFSKMKIYARHFSDTTMNTMCCQNLAVLASKNTLFAWNCAASFQIWTMGASCWRIWG